MLVYEMTTWAELHEVAQRLRPEDRAELARFLNFGGVADRVALLEAEAESLSRATKRAGWHSYDGKTPVFERRRFVDDMKQIKRGRKDLEGKVDDALAVGVAAFAQKAKAGERIAGYLSGHDCAAIQHWLITRSGRIGAA